MIQILDKSIDRAILSTFDKKELSRILAPTASLLVGIIILWGKWIELIAAFMIFYGLLALSRLKAVDDLIKGGKNDKASSIEDKGNEPGNCCCDTTKKFFSLGYY